MLVARRKPFITKIDQRTGHLSWRFHVLSVRQFTRECLDEVIFPEAESMLSLVKNVGKVDFLSGMVLALLFYETSTRTRKSFEVAILRLGGDALEVVDPEHFSSVSKGENLPDTIRTLGAYADAVVIRHKQEGTAAEAAKISPVPIINAGDGKGEHPTQALLDLFTIKRELGQIDDLVVTMVGDLANGRTVHSLARLLTLYRGIKINFVSPPSLKMPAHLISELRGQGVIPCEYERIDDVIDETNVLYVTRVQRERLPEDQRGIDNPFIVTPELMSSALPGKKMILMHPLPRVGEIIADMDNDPRAAYFRQAEYGMLIRMALLKLILRGE